MAKKIWQIQIQTQVKKINKYTKNIIFFRSSSSDLSLYRSEQGMVLINIVNLSLSSDQHRQSLSLQIRTTTRHQPITVLHPPPRPITDPNNKICRDGFCEFPENRGR
ncbi:hypothetical protein LOK49_LG04G03454 [Camellia lanceoleosa]|uniref:Uncharacterized protein n=1 Tax=Camellia lanceoleosa TaxID=1840588 RepID=A0ACC0I1Z9_9ERIC|nr:hypothetical protein LOK49_LG04G03454 [Camellia lanceoleosa]